MGLGGVVCRFYSCQLVIEIILDTIIVIISFSFAQPA